jgi:hypothetical protein
MAQMRKSGAEHDWHIPYVEQANEEKEQRQNHISLARPGSQPA